MPAAGPLAQLPPVRQGTPSRVALCMACSEIMHDSLPLLSTPVTSFGTHRPAHIHSVQQHRVNAHGAVPCMAFHQPCNSSQHCVCMLRNAVICFCEQLVRAGAHLLVDARGRCILRQRSCRRAGRVPVHLRAPSISTSSCAHALTPSCFTTGLLQPPGHADKACMDGHLCRLMLPCIYGNQTAPLQEEVAVVMHYQHSHRLPRAQGRPQSQNTQFASQTAHPDAKQAAVDAGLASVPGAHAKHVEGQQQGVRRHLQRVLDHPPAGTPRL